MAAGAERGERVRAGAGGPAAAVDAAFEGRACFGGAEGEGRGGVVGWVVGVGVDRRVGWGVVDMTVGHETCVRIAGVVRCDGAEVVVTVGDATCVPARRVRRGGVGTDRGPGRPAGRRALEDDLLNIRAGVGGAGRERDRSRQRRSRVGQGNGRTVGVDLDGGLDGGGVADVVGAGEGVAVAAGGEPVLGGVADDRGRGGEGAADVGELKEALVRTSVEEASPDSVADWVSL